LACLEGLLIVGEGTKEIQRNVIAAQLVSRAGYKGWRVASYGRVFRELSAISGHST
jgi:hypothetical protein